MSFAERGSPPALRSLLPGTPAGPPDEVLALLTSLWDRLNRPDETGERKVRIHAIGFPTIFSKGRFGENTGLRFATLMRLLCEQNGGVFVALNDLTPWGSLAGVLDPP